VFNPLVRRVAGRAHFAPAAQITHRGRRTGQLHVTPASARSADGRLWVPLTFGIGSDWCRNVRAAGGCTVRLKGFDYRATGPVVVDRAAALSSARRAFRPHERAMMRLLGITQFLRLDVEGADRREPAAASTGAQGASPDL
jgi:deazaflavin-dependent oxidoreductase (nitroreductase family)